jgi:hypothetical protein
MTGKAAGAAGSGASSLGGNSLAANITWQKRKVLLFHNRLEFYIGITHLSSVGILLDDSIDGPSLHQATTRKGRPRWWSAR